VHYRIVTETRRVRRARRGRTAKTDPLPVETCYRIVGEVAALPQAEIDNRWTVLATTLRPEVCSDAEILPAYHEQHTTVEPGFRWIKNPAAIRPVWLEKAERIAALAMLTVMGLLVYTLIQRQVRLYLHLHSEQVPGNKGATALPTAAVVFAVFSPVTRVRVRVGRKTVDQLYGVHRHH
jgi:transposase